MPLKKLFTFVLIVSLITSCKKKDVKTDNIFKFRDYISYTTSGTTSATSSIQINLAKEVEGWEMDQEITDKIINIKPHVEGKLTVGNNHTLLFKPDEGLEPDTEYAVTVKLGDIYKDIPKDYKSYTFQFKTIKPNFNVITNSLQSYSKKWQYLEGIIKSADIIFNRKSKTIN